MRRSVIKLSPRHEWAIYSVVAVIFATGAAWAWLHYFGRDDSLGETNAAEPWLMKVHGAAAMAMLVLIGTLLPYHAKFAWRARRNRRTGSTLLALFGFLIVSGYGLYYAGGERLRAWTSSSHLYVGLALPLLIALHVWRGKKTKANMRRE